MEKFRNSGYPSGTLRNSKRLSLSEINALCLRAKEHKCRKSQEKIVNSLQRFVFKVAHLYSSKVSNAEFCELVQEANMGVLRAVELYEPTRGYEFTTYAVWWMRQNITKFLSEDKLVHIPKNVQNDIRKAEKAAAGGVVTEDLLLEMGFSKARAEKVVMVMAREFLNLEKPMSENSDTPLMDILEVDAETDLNVEDDISEIKYINEICTEYLSPKEREVVMKLYPIEEGMPVHSLKDLSKSMGITHERVKELRDRALAKLRVYVEKDEVIH